VCPRGAQVLPYARRLGDGAAGEWALERDRRPDALDLTSTNPSAHGLTSPQVGECLARAARRGAYQPDPRGPLAAREALAARFGRSPDRYWLTASTSEAYAWLFQLLTVPGEAVAAPQPGYPLIEPLARLAGVGVRDYWYHYLDHDGWVLDAATLDPRGPVRAVVAVNPGNPTGCWAPLDGIGQRALSAGAALVVDQVFQPFALDAEAPAGTSPPEECLVFTLDGVSKRLAAPGVKLGWIALDAPPETAALVAPALDRVADCYLSASQAAAEALPDLLGLEEQTVTRVRERTRGNLAELRRRWPGRVRRAEAGWTAVADAPAPEPGLAVRLLREAGLAVHPGWFYGVPGDKALVLSLLPAPAEFAAGLDALAAAL
jgi:aspartate/methionine/tyrosine aminotransferase